MDNPNPKPLTAGSEGGGGALRGGHFQKMVMVYVGLRETIDMALKVCLSPMKF